LSFEEVEVGKEKPKPHPEKKGIFQSEVYSRLLDYSDKLY